LADFVRFGDVLGSVIEYVKYCLESLTTIASSVVGVLVGYVAVL
jgi:hypothetical protein